MCETWAINYKFNIKICPKFAKIKNWREIYETVAIKKIKILLTKIVTRPPQVKNKSRNKFGSKNSYIYPFYYENNFDKSVADVN